MSYELVVVGSSWGGLEALRVLLGGLPSDFPAAVALAQHQGPSSTSTNIARHLEPHSVLPIVEADDKGEIVGGRVYMGPADYHLLIDDDGFALSTDERVVFSRPSVDVLFESAADVFTDRLIAVVLTGANADGADGVVHVKRRGGYTIAQDPATAVKEAMPSAAIATGAVDAVVPLEDIASRLTRLCRP